ncbi:MULTISPECIES: carbohydrate ABC transporter permease [unclassified Paenibacillus]|uniref:carbohydrate ABC transporter permease n=1 Tax=unclassified Paenibacillus TaxID=185978 RepID=UPI0027805D71|nr:MULTISPECIES: carbohydrate ABC transporter permease [unclassified Paenibacillus]MDQ0898474.1 ABC-type glycerol-3-phosphate transport system permease component [Paenibacillus sp. V4I7]MDQ0915530.1 ABC-type glycerol-3-phosphate transport system permease component [Paenibacillus sp. V4I5]
MNNVVALRKFNSWRKRKRLRKFSPTEKVSMVILVLMSIFLLLPLIYIFNHAFKPYHELFIYPPNIFVREPSFQNFLELVSITKSTAVPITRYLFNSFVVTGLAVVAITIVSAMCAYPISKHKFPGHKIMFATILLTLLFVPEVVAIPRYLIVSNLGIFNTYWGHVLPLVAVPTGVFLMKQFIDQLPDELLDSARIDGAKEFTLFIKIVIPVVMPAIATIGIIAFNSAWGNTETSAMFMQDEEMRTFPFYMETLTSGLANSVARQGAAAAAAMLLFLPNFIMFLAFQSKVIATMAHSGIK